MSGFLTRVLAAPRKVLWSEGEERIWAKRQVSEVLSSRNPPPQLCPRFWTTQEIHGDPWPLVKAASEAERTTKRQKDVRSQFLLRL